MSDVVAVESAAPSARQRRPAMLLLAGAWRQRRTKVGASIVLSLMAIAFVGPFFAPHSPTEFVGLPFSPPSHDAVFGTDNIGRDVLTRFLWGGRSVLTLSGIATGLGVALGIAVGLVAAYSRWLLDDVLMRSMDVILAFPPIVLGLVAVATVGPKLWLLVLAVGLTTVPRVARVTRGAAIEVVRRDFVRALEAMGVSRFKILLAEVLPNAMSPLVVEASIGLTFNVALIASLSFLSFGLQPPSADWGLMVNENRSGLTVMPWGVALPVVAIGLLTIGTSLVGDGLARAVIGVESGRLPAGESGAAVVPLEPEKQQNIQW